MATGSGRRFGVFFGWLVSLNNSGFYIQFPTIGLPRPQHNLAKIDGHLEWPLDFGVFCFVEFWKTIKIEISTSPKPPKSNGHSKWPLIWGGGTWLSGNPMVGNWMSFFCNKWMDLEIKSQMFFLGSIIESVGFRLHRLRVDKQFIWPWRIPLRREVGERPLRVTFRGSTIARCSHVRIWCQWLRLWNCQLNDRMFSRSWLWCTAICLGL